MTNYYVEKGKRFLKKTRKERNRLLLNKIRNLSAVPFYFGRARFLNIFIAYSPDSHNAFNAHPEFIGLFKKFTRNNQLNNAGDTPRLWSFVLNIKQIIAENIEGDFAELGVWRGNTASVLAHFGALSNRKVFLFDTYEGFNINDLDGIDSNKQMVDKLDELIGLMKSGGIAVNMDGSKVSTALGVATKFRGAS